MRKKQSGSLIEQIAANHGVPVDEVVKEIQFAIDATWENLDPAVRSGQRELLQSGKPSVEEFIKVIAKNKLRNKP